MKPHHEQLLEETNYPELVRFLRSGGALEMGTDVEIGGFARIRQGNRTVILSGAYRDLAAVLKKMNSGVTEFFDKEVEGLQ